MNTSYRFIHFIQHGEHNGKPMWECRNNKDSGIKLGIVFWYPTWKQYCFTQDGPNVVFSADCLTDIAHFMGQLPKP